METEKLNKRERYKAQLKPIDYYKDFEKLDFENLGEGDRFYLQDFGIYNVDFLEDEFTLRLRLPAGRIESDDFVAVAEVVREFGLTMILTARGGIQLHGIEAENILEIYKRINALRLTTWQSFGDNVRNFVADVYDGCGKYAKIEVYDVLMQMHNFIIKNPRYVGMLPRRLSVAISGNSANVTSFFSNDLYFALAQKDGEFGFNVYMGGKNIEVAQNADIFLKKEEVFDFFVAFVEAFYLHGSRFSRAKTRLFHMIEEHGMDGVKNFILQEYKGVLRSGGELVLERGDFGSYHELNDGKFSYCYQSDFSRLKADEVVHIAQIAREHNATIRFGADQKVYIMGLESPECELVSPAISQTIVACAGNLCPYAVWSIKNETSYLPLQRIEKHRIQVGFSGCAKGCGRHRHTDIGLIGLKTNNFGDTDGGARIFLGALHSDGSSVGRQLFSMVPFVHLHGVMDLVIDLYELSGCSYFEEYAREILENYSEEFVSLWTLANLETKKVVKLDKLDSMATFEDEVSMLKAEFGELDFWSFVKEGSFFDAISYLSKKLWTVDGEDPHYKPAIERTNFR